MMTPNTKVTTGKCRANYPNVFTPKASNFNDKEEYSVQLLIPKSDKTTINNLKSAIKAAVDKKWPTKPPANLRTPIRDGDEEHPEMEHFLGCYFVNMKTTNKPGIIDKDRQDVIESDALLSGDYCRVSGQAYAYDQAGNRGVSIGLNNVQILGKGEPIGGSGRVRAEDEFSVWEDDDDVPF